MKGSVPLCQSHVQTFTMSSRIGELISLEICPQGLHKLSQNPDLASCNFLRRGGPLASYSIQANKFCSEASSFRIEVLLHAINLRHGTSGFTSLQKEAILRPSYMHTNFSGGVELLEGEPENEEVRKHLLECGAWIMAYFRNPFNTVSMPELCSNIVSKNGGFQQLVWLRLADMVGPGTIVSYKTLAKYADNPGAARAVGMAMARNPFHILVPCHRVICSDGSMGQYDSGRRNEVKEWLLNHEGWKVVDGKVERSF